MFIVFIFAPCSHNVGFFSQIWWQLPETQLSSDRSGLQCSSSGHHRHLLAQDRAPQCSYASAPPPAAKPPPPPSSPAARNLPGPPISFFLPVTCPSVQGFTALEGYDHYGNDITQMSGATLLALASACDISPMCYAFNWSPYSYIPSGYLKTTGANAAESTGLCLYRWIGE